MLAKLRISGTTTVFDVEPGEDLLECLQRHGCPVNTSCGGNARCGLCRVTIEEGGGHLSPIQSEEIAHLGNVAKLIGGRLACQSRFVTEGEVVVKIPPVEDVEGRRRRKAERLRAERAHAQSQPAEGNASDPGRPAQRAKREIIEWRPRMRPKREG